VNLTRIPMTSLRHLLLSAFALAALAGCGGSDQPAEEEGGVLSTLNRLNDVREAAGSLEERANAMAEQGPAEPVDFRRLRDLLPAEALGFAQSDAEGSKDGAMGFSISKASATYAGDEVSTSLAVSDLGGAQFAMMMGLAWTMAEIDRESSTGFERTMTFEGYPGFADYDSENRSGKIQVLVADRFLVEASGRGVSYEQIEELARTIDLGTLDGWKDEGRQAS
jgi:hypothetical protein